MLFVVTVSLLFFFLASSPSNICILVPATLLLFSSSTHTHHYSVPPVKIDSFSPGRQIITSFLANEAQAFVPRVMFCQPHPNLLISSVIDAHSFNPFLSHLRFSRPLRPQLHAYIPSSCSTSLSCLYAFTPSVYCSGAVLSWR